MTKSLWCGSGELVVATTSATQFLTSQQIESVTRIFNTSAAPITVTLTNEDDDNEFHSVVALPGKAIHIAHTGVYTHIKASSAGDIEVRPGYMGYGPDITISDDDVKNILDAFQEPATPDLAVAIGEAVAAIKALGVWDKLDALYYPAHTEQAGCVNWKSPGTFTLEKTTNGFSYIPFKGFLLEERLYSTNSSPQFIYVSTGISFGLSDVKVSIHDAHGAGYQLTEDPGAYATIMSAVNGGAIRWDLSNRHNQLIYGSFRGQAVVNLGRASSVVGFYVQTNVDGTAKLFVDGLSVASVIRPTASIVTAPSDGIRLYEYPNAPSNRGIANCFHIGSFITSAEVAGMFEIHKSYLRKIGSLPQ